MLFVKVFTHCPLRLGFTFTISSCAGRQSEQAYDSDEHLDEQQNVSLTENALCRLRQFS